MGIGPQSGAERDGIRYRLYGERVLFCRTRYAAGTSSVSMISGYGVTPVIVVANWGRGDHLI
jgi:hypothetical protein